MNLENAIQMALKYEGGVHRIYLEAMKKTSDNSAKRIFEQLCREERSHLAYLRERLDEWHKEGKIHVKKLGTSIPARAVIEKSLKDLGKTVKPKPTRRLLELKLLRQALAAEVKTSTFFKKMVQTLDAEGQKMFQRFVEIEEGHEAIVQAEIDSMTNLGFWFDTPEFRLEME